jgi:hypothetical protein
LFYLPLTRIAPSFADKDSYGFVPMNSLLHP